MDATLTGWIILVAAWLVSRFVASRLVDRNFKILEKVLYSKYLSQVEFQPIGVAKLFPRSARAQLSVRSLSVSDMVWDLCLQHQTRTKRVEKPAHQSDRHFACCAF